MRPIHLFLEYAIKNLVPLNEYADKIVNALVKHYMDQADDYGYDKLTPEQLKKLIKRFDKIKDTVKNKEGLELFKMKGGEYEPLIDLPKFMQLVTGAADVEAEPESDQDAYRPDTRPNVIYTSDDGSVVVYKGSQEDLCIRFRTQTAQDVPWCITRSSYGTYRYARERGYPTFYLAKNENLPSTDPLSAVAIQVTDPKLKSDSSRYRWTNRKNSPNESGYMNWDELVNDIPWLADIPNAKQELKYIELTPEEKRQVAYGNNPITVQEWLDKSYQQKIAYLDARASRGSRYSDPTLFSNVSDENFATRILPRFPSVAQHVAENVSIVKSETLLRGYDKYPKDVQKSIISNTLTGGQKLNVEMLENESIPFQALLDITDRNGWNSPDKYYYSTKDRSAIVGLETDNGGTVKLSIYTPDYSKENVKLTQRTAKFVEQNPAPSKIPIRDLNGLIKAGIMTSDGVMKSFEDDKRAPVAVKRDEDGDFVLDSRTLSVYKVDDNGFSRASNDTADTFDEELNSPVLRNKAVSIVRDALKNRTRIPRSIDVISLSKILAKTPYEDRIDQQDNNVVIAVPGEYPIIMAADPNENIQRNGSGVTYPQQAWSNNGSFDSSPQGTDYNFSDPEIQGYITYLKRSGKTIKDPFIRQYLDIVPSGRSISFLNANYPIDPENRFIAVAEGDTVFLINKDRPSENYRRAPNNSRLVSGKLSPTRAQQMLQAAQPRAATQAQMAQRVQAARAQQAAGGEEQPAAGEQPAAPAAQAAPQQGDLTGAQVQQAFTDRNISYNTLPNAIRSRIAAGGQTVTQVAGDRGAGSRNALLGNRGRVTGIIRLTGRSSAVYFIRLASGTNIASIALQPGNYQYIATANNSYQLRSIENLTAVLQARNINEEVKGMCIREFLANNPSMVDEVKACTQKYLKERNMKKLSLQEVLADVLRKRALKENNPAVEPDIDTDTDIEVDPDDEPIFTPKPGANPAPKMKNNPTPGEKDVLGQIMNRYQKLKERRK